MVVVVVVIVVVGDDDPEMERDEYDVEDSGEDTVGCREGD